MKIHHDEKKTTINLIVEFRVLFIQVNYLSNQHA